MTPTVDGDEANGMVPSIIDPFAEAEESKLRENAMVWS